MIYPTRVAAITCDKHDLDMSKPVFCCRKALVLSKLQGPVSPTIKPAGIRDIRGRDKIKDRDLCFIVGISTHRTPGLVVDEIDTRILWVTGYY